MLNDAIGAGWGRCARINGSRRSIVRQGGGGRFSQQDLNGCLKSLGQSGECSFLRVRHLTVLNTPHGLQAEVAPEGHFRLRKP